MSDFIGARISLISKSDIRYSGVLHEINSEESTVSLENVLSFGTEGRKTQQGKADEEVPPADQVYEYIVFRGSDVKDLRIEETPAAKENKPPAIPNDPAIVNARTRPAANAPPGGPPFPPGAPGMPMPPGPGFGPGPGPNMFMGPHPGWAPPPGPPGRGQFQYPPPMPGPGWYPPGQGFPPGGPGGPGPWSNNFPPNGPGGPGGPNGPQGPGARQQPPKTPDTKPSPIGGAQAKATATSSNDAPQGPKVPGQTGAPATAAAPVPPVASKPSVEEVKATAASLTANAKNASIGFGAAPTGPRAAHITPAVPLPAALTQKAAQPAVAQQPADQGPANAAALRDATQAAKAAVAVAMANLERSAAGLPPQAQQSNGNAMDNLTRKVNEMRVNANRPNNYSNRGGRGGRGGGRVGKIDVPDADFDFESSNAKFDKEALLKEAIAGSPLADAPDVDPTDVHDTSAANPPPAYNKTKSFFDNISSEAKDRADNSQKPGGREWRGEEQRKNIETFGQGSVDGGHRGYRGRGRGRGGGRGRGYNQGRGGRGNFRRNEGQPAMQ